jgi:hypothetical protein
MRATPARKQSIKPITATPVLTPPPVAADEAAG